MEYLICTAQNTWSETEGQLLMEKFRDYRHEIGPMKKFKNKKAMWEKISADILAELGSLKTGPQCENRYKTVRKRKGWSDDLLGDQTDNNGSTISGDERDPKCKQNKITSKKTGNVRKIKDSNSLQQISKEGEDLIEVSVRRGVGQVSFSSAAVESNEEEERKEKKRLRQTLSSVLIQIHREKEEAKERRHQEKMELLKSILL